MTDQPTLFGEAPAGTRLGRSQQLVLDAVTQAGPDGLTADEAGALVHEQRDHHAYGERCTWCARDGRQVLASLRKRGLVKKRKRGGWVHADARPPKPARLSDDLPEGF